MGNIEGFKVESGKWSMNLTKIKITIFCKFKFRKQQRNFLDTGKMRLKLDKAESDQGGPIFKSSF